MFQSTRKKSMCRWTAAMASRPWRSTSKSQIGPALWEDGRTAKPEWPEDPATPILKKSQGEPRLRYNHRFRLAALPPDHELVEGAQIGLGGGHERIRIGPFRSHRLAVFGQANRHFGLRVGAFGYRMHLVEFQHRVMRHQSLDAVEGRVHRPVTLACLDPDPAVDVELHGGALRPVGAGDD